MSVYIKGMEMPTSCGDCKAFVCYRQWAGDAGDCFCGITKSDAKAKTKNADCPLVHIPPHGDLISRSALIVDLMDRGIEGIQTDDWHEIQQVVADVPTIIPADPAEEGEG